MKELERTTMRVIMMKYSKEMKSARTVGCYLYCTHRGDQYDPENSDILADAVVKEILIFDYFVQRARRGSH